MTVTRLLVICCTVLAFAAPVSAQNWGAGSSQGILRIDWTREADRYTFIVRNPEVVGRAYQVLGISLVPFNLPAPAEVTCPEGWVWRGGGGSNRFELDKQDQRYAVGGPSLEPGEILTFGYRILDGSDVVNPGGPGGDAPAFMSHVLAVDGQKDGKWLSVKTSLGESWYDVPLVSGSSTLGSSTPEPAGVVVVFSAFLCTGLFRRKRARV